MAKKRKAVAKITWLIDNSHPLAGSLREVGNLTRLAKRLNVSRQRLTYWVENRIPAEHVGRVAKILGVKKHLLRPDIWGPNEG